MLSLSTSGRDVDASVVLGDSQSRARFEERTRTRAQLLLEVPDAIGMAFYSVYGAYVTLHCCDEANGPLVAVLMGLCTSTYGPAWKYSTRLQCERN